MTEKAIIITIGAVLTAITGWFGWFFWLMALMMFLDFITGTMASHYQGIPVTSSCGKKGLMKKLYIVILVSAVYAIEHTLISPMAIGIETIPIIQPFIDAFAEGGLTGGAVAFMFAVMELVSIVENGERMSVVLPKPLKELVNKLANMLKSGD